MYFSLPHFACMREHSVFVNGFRNQRIWFTELHISANYRHYCRHILNINTHLPTHTWLVCRLEFDLALSFTHAKLSEGEGLEGPEREERSRGGKEHHCKQRGSKVWGRTEEKVIFNKRRVSSERHWKMWGMLSKGNAGAYWWPASTWRV